MVHSLPLQLAFPAICLSFQCRRQRHLSQRRQPWINQAQVINDRLHWQSLLAKPSATAT
jgi:hypothetical protein